MEGWQLIFKQNKNNAKEEIVALSINITCRFQISSTSITAKKLS